jgi:Yip1 domain
VEPVYLPRATVLAICTAYFGALLFGYLSSALIARWMATTYDASQSFGRCLALMSIVGAPLAVGSVIHLYPHAFLNVLVLVPVLIWSMFLLYRGLPVVLATGPNRGMLMASALIAYLLVALVSLLGITVALWGHGIGPSIGT